MEPKELAAKLEKEFEAVSALDAAALQVSVEYGNHEIYAALQRAFNALFDAMQEARRSAGIYTGE